MVKKNLINAYKFWVNKIFHLKSSNYIDEESYMYLFKLIQCSFIREILYSIEYTEEDSTQITRLIETHLKTFTDRYSSELNQDYLFQDKHFIQRFESFYKIPFSAINCKIQIEERIREVYHHLYVYIILYVFFELYSSNFQSCLENMIHEKRYTLWSSGPNWYYLEDPLEELYVLNTRRPKLRKNKPGDGETFTEYGYDCERHLIVSADWSSFGKITSTKYYILNENVCTVIMLNDSGRISSINIRYYKEGYIQKYETVTLPYLVASYDNMGFYFNYTSKEFTYNDISLTSSISESFHDFRPSFEEMLLKPVAFRYEKQMNEYISNDKGELISYTIKEGIRKGIYKIINESYPVPSKLKNHSNLDDDRWKIPCL